MGGGAERRSAWRLTHRHHTHRSAVSLLPLFFKWVPEKNIPTSNSGFQSFTTDQIITQLEKQHLDAGILATPLRNGFW